MPRIPRWWYSEEKAKSCGKKRESRIKDEFGRLLQQEEEEEKKSLSKWAATLQMAVKM
jgi:hypothetical protein